MTLPEGTEMIILVTDNEVTVTYNGLPLEVIALVAEGGDDTEINWDEYPHTYVDDDGNWTCDYCGIGAFSHG